MKAQDIRRKFLEFAKDNGHAIIPSAPVVPENDPTTLFNIAGMQPLVPYLLGEPHPAGKRLANVQKCIRTVDLDEVGDSTHNTFMEMLGWWSLGDYFKEKTIEMSWQLFTEVLRLDVSRLCVTIFEGDETAPRDVASEKLWLQQGVSKDRIFALGRGDNWWELPGPGPCGPSTEIFYWTGAGKPNPQGPEADERWVELGNNVLMQFEKKADGGYVPIIQRNVDTGLGFERIVAALQGADNVYETDLYLPILEKIRELATSSDIRAERIIADHLKAATFMIADGVRPSNTDQGYILRRLIRRAVRQGKLLGASFPFTEAIAEVVTVDFQDAYPELSREASIIHQVLLEEETKFARTLDRGLKELGKLTDPDGKRLFHVFETYGIPLEVSLEELVMERTPDLEKQYKEAFKEHQAKSRAGSAKKFAGGLADHSDKTLRLHTATHLLNAALQDVLGEHVKQRGSNITPERLRFDFAHPEKLTDEERNQVEALVNEWIKEDLPVTRKQMPLAEAKRIGAQMEFGHKYPDIVSVYFVGDPNSARSKEFCGGPHVERTGIIGTFKIQKQESSGAGVRRIKATVG